MNVYEEFIEMMKQNNLTKEAVIDVLNLYVNGHKFLQHLEEFKNKEGERREYNGIIYSDEYEQDEEEYFGQNKVLFYSGDGDDDYDIVSYDELYQYISAACNFYIERNPEKTELIEELLMKIKEKYDIK
ncbi:ribonuclease toxin immunity protein CdiI [Bacillus haynesii]|uniref:ribonuclease toxin immunity protein CdiI n=1 Tax=Bacillus haynesii TaxID=1925021 RepID=UPI00227E2204|nr:ribonuclease toxin immunity protein CdiI [Bacillus haynesii]MCY8141801.1 ribonuclease toxin immunity protein CdiI [Bacillus haynesii]MEC1455403.1 ribonuclease toxin immunity protein CdiI [Bacillus haynesii]MEC1573911.1 ribonuclease toxin immunity protein CdiI [Bacillus haynesii]